jgi:hypothetical protein
MNAKWILPIEPEALILLVPLGIAVLAAVLNWNLDRRRRALGRVLWSAERPKVAFALLFLVGARLAYAMARSLRTPHAGIFTLLGSACWLYFSAVADSFLPASFFVQESGIATGLRCLPWEEISAWEWGYVAETEGTTGILSLHLTGPDRRRLFLWKHGRRLRTGIIYDEALDALLKQHALTSVGTKD